MRIAAVIITYNQANFITEALAGVFQQTRQADEIVIADDGSTDDTPRIIRDYVENSGLKDRCILLLSKNNRGINVNLQSAIDQTTAEIIIGFTGDDISLPNRIAHTEQLFESNPSVNHIVTAGYMIDSKGEIIKEISYEDALHSDLIATIKKGVPPVPPFGSAWRKDLFEVFGKLPFDVPNEDDQLLFRGMLLGGLLVSSVKTYKYRVHSNSASSWLRNKTTDEEFLSRFKKDQLVRHHHMIHWQTAMKMIPRIDHPKLITMLEQKAALYQWLQHVDTINLIDRIVFFIKNYKILCGREAVYTLLGKFGILGWRKLRRLTGRI